MNFTDFGFWPRLLICLAIVFSAKAIARAMGRPLPPTFDRIALAAISLYLLSCVDALTFWFFILLATISYIGVHIIARTPTGKRELVLAFAIPIVLIPLAYFKYRTFLVEEVFGWEAQTFDAIAIPAGISFYTFQKVAVLVDAARQPSFRPTILNFLNFASFFPQVVAGPIERKEELMPQMERFQFVLSMKHLNAGASWLALGFFYKLVLADNLSPFINRDAMESAWPILWMTFLFGLKIYFDFCGYSLIALGIARCLGVELTLNFRSPYLSTTIRDFWRRWHVSLSYWFRDYVYIPLGGSRTAFWALSLMVVFLASGLWHGAGWAFLLWGGMHGAYCVIGHTLKDRFRLPAFVGWISTLVLVFAAWLPFYETRWPVLCQKVTILFSPSNYAVNLLGSYARSFDAATIFTMLAVVGLCLLILALEAHSARKKRFYDFANNPVAIAVLVVATIWLGSADGNSFIYFQF